MSMNIFASASGLSDQDLLARLTALATREREVTVELIAHLAALQARPSVYAGLGYGSLFGYCTQALGFSEDAACSRIAVAQTCRRLPKVLDALATGAVSLTAVRMLSPVLNEANHERVLARASGRRCREIEALVAELAPRPDVPSTIRRLPAPAAIAPPASVPDRVAPPASSPPVPPSATASTGEAIEESRPPLAATKAPIIENTSPERYRIQFTIGKAGHDDLRRLQELLRREIPSGDPAAIIERALALLLARVEKDKLGATAKPRPIRTETDSLIRTPIIRSRDIPNDVRRGVSRRDAGQCGYVAPNGVRCTERTFLEFHHIRAYALGGAATVENVSLRCRRHNQYEAELVFGAHGGRPDHDRGVSGPRRT
jgi:hypothetical protein